jgi:hypothetical protein
VVAPAAAGGRILRTIAAPVARVAASRHRDCARDRFDVHYDSTPEAMEALAQQDI